MNINLYAGMRTPAQLCQCLLDSSAVGTGVTACSAARFGRNHASLDLHQALISQSDFISPNSNKSSWVGLDYLIAATRATIGFGGFPAWHVSEPAMGAFWHQEDQIPKK